jgi:membrane-associated phospholipid phosphatase
LIVRTARLPWGRLGAGAVAAALLLPNSSVFEHRAIICVFLFALAAGQGRQFARDWLPLSGAAALFVVVRQLAASSPFPHRGLEVASLEAALFGGLTPTEWLQRLRSQADWTALDSAATLVHGSYFFAFVVAGLWLWLRRREHFGAYSAAIALTFAAGLLGYYLVPTEPPWLAARLQAAPRAERVIVETTRGTPVASAVMELGRRWQSDPDALGDPNPAAAMPSVHVAITAVLGLFFFRVHLLAGAAGLVYLAAMAASLVYLGEHFVLDEVAGLLCAVGALAVASRLALLRRGL